MRGSPAIVSETLTVRDLKTVVALGHLAGDFAVKTTERASVLLRSRSDVQHLTGLSLSIYFPIIILGLTVVWKKSFHCRPIEDFLFFILKFNCLFVK